MSFEVSWATARDLIEFNSQLPQQTMRAQVGRLDGDIVALWGLIIPREGVVGMVSEIRPEMSHLKVTIHKTAKKFLREVADLGFSEVCALADPDIEGSARWLEALGFHYCYDTEDGEVWRWLRHSHS